MIKGSCHFIGRSQKRLSYHPAKVGDQRHRGIKDIMVLVCHVISQGHVIKVFVNSKVLWLWRYIGLSLSHDLARQRKQRVR